jgi:hypothetical protein
MGDIKFFKKPNKTTETSGDFLRGKTVFVATPAYGGWIHLATVDLVFNHIFAKTRPGRIDWAKMGNESHILRARNALWTLFLKTDATHLLFLDADVTANFPIINILLTMQKDVIGGMVPLKGFDEKGNRIFSHGQVYREEGDLVSVEWVGNACLMISREAAKKYMDFYKPETYEGNPRNPTMAGQEIYDVFGYDVVDRRYLSEDEFICKRFREMGIEVFMYTGQPMTHYGTIPI